MCCITMAYQCSASLKQKQTKKQMITTSQLAGSDVKTSSLCMHVCRHLCIMLLLSSHRQFACLEFSRALTEVFLHKQRTFIHRPRHALPYHTRARKLLKQTYWYMRMPKAYQRLHAIGFSPCSWIVLILSVNIADTHLLSGIVYYSNRYCPLCAYSHQVLVHCCAFLCCFCSAHYRYHMDYPSIHPPIHLVTAA